MQISRVMMNAALKITTKAQLPSIKVGSLTIIHHARITNFRCFILNQEQYVVANALVLYQEPSGALAHPTRVEIRYLAQF